VLALEIRASKVGFAVIEMPGRLLDWGVRSLAGPREQLRSVVADRIATLLAFHRPYAVVVRIRKYHSRDQNRKFGAIVSAARTETRRHSTKFRTITSVQVKAHFALNGEMSKHDIAETLADQFEELSWKLPAHRKPYQTEARAMLIFDALANGVAFTAGRTPSTSDAHRKS
jgi:hypothetical protein